MMLAAALNVERYHLSPEALGFDGRDPRVYAQMNLALNVYHAAMDRKAHQAQAKQGGARRKGTPPPPSWERLNPDRAKLLAWARGQGESKDPMAVQVELPTRPRKGK